MGSCCGEELAVQGRQRAWVRAARDLLLLIGTQRITNNCNYSAAAMPVELRVGSTGAGLFVGCGAGIGIVTPLSLHAVPVLGQLVSAERAANRRGRWGRSRASLTPSLHYRRAVECRSRAAAQLVAVAAAAAQAVPLRSVPPSLPLSPLDSPAGRQPVHLAVHSQLRHRRRDERSAAARAVAGRARPRRWLWLRRHAWLRLGRWPHAQAVRTDQPDGHAPVSRTGSSGAPAAADAGGAGAAASAAAGSRRLGANSHGGSGCGLGQHRSQQHSTGLAGLAAAPAR